MQDNSPGKILHLITSTKTFPPYCNTVSRDQYLISLFRPLYTLRLRWSRYLFLLRLTCVWYGFGFPACDNNADTSIWKFTECLIYYYIDRMPWNIAWWYWWDSPSERWNWELYARVPGIPWSSHMPYCLVYFHVWVLAERELRDEFISLGHCSRFKKCVNQEPLYRLLYSSYRIYRSGRKSGIRINFLIISLKGPTWGIYTSHSSIFRVKLN